MDPSGPNLIQAGHCSRQLTLKGAAIIDVLKKLTHRQPALIKQLKAHTTTAGQALCGQIDAQGVDTTLVHSNRAALIGQLKRLFPRIKRIANSGRV
jgi:hypothetical protein